jgi:hypothetical protein
LSRGLEGIRTLLFKGSKYFQNDSTEELSFNFDVSLPQEADGFRIEDVHETLFLLLERMTEHEANCTMRRVERHAGLVEVVAL